MNEKDKTTKGITEDGILAFNDALTFGRLYPYQKDGLDMLMKYLQTQRSFEPMGMTPSPIYEAGLEGLLFTPLDRHQYITFFRRYWTVRQFL